MDCDIHDPARNTSKDVYFASLDLEKPYDRVDRNAMWNVLRLHGNGSRLVRSEEFVYGQ